MARNSNDQCSTSKAAECCEPDEPAIEEEYDSMPDAVLDKRIIRSKVIIVGR